MTIIVVRFPDERAEGRRFLNHLHRSFLAVEHPKAIRWIQELHDRFGVLEWSYVTTKHRVWTCPECAERVSHP